MTLQDAVELARTYRKSGYLYREAIFRASKESGYPYSQIASELGKSGGKNKREQKFINFN
jgi:hypothetical protein